MAPVPDPPAAVPVCVHSFGMYCACDLTSNLFRKASERSATLSIDAAAPKLPLLSPAADGRLPVRIQAYSSSRV